LVYSLRFASAENTPTSKLKEAERKKETLRRIEKY